MDKFEYSTGPSSFKNKELERLFPNDEINRISKNISQEYGIENPPKIEFLNDFKECDRGYYNAIDNKIKIVLDFLKPTARKILIQKDGQSFYTVGDSRNLLFRSNKNDIEKEIKDIKTYGFEATAEPLTDDDKRKILIFVLSHELSHAYQNQTIRKTEGLSEWKMIEEKLSNSFPKEVNLIQRKINLIKLKQKYNENHSMISKEKIYDINSPQGKLAQEWYNATISYSKPEDNYENNITNPLEIDANQKAYNYLKTHYGYFENAIEF